MMYEILFMAVIFGIVYNIILHFKGHPDDNHS